MTKFDSAAFVICCCVTVTLKKRGGTPDQCPGHILARSMVDKLSDRTTHIAYDIVPFTSGRLFTLLQFHLAGVQIHNLWIMNNLLEMF